MSDVAKPRLPVVWACKHPHPAFVGSLPYSLYCPKCGSMALCWDEHVRPPVIPLWAEQLWCIVEDNPRGGSRIVWAHPSQHGAPPDGYAEVHEEFPELFVRTKLEQ